ncbi:hypothetical protein ACFQY7_25095 [Actinomadura luteofluorescens]
MTDSTGAFPGLVPSPAAPKVALPRATRSRRSCGPRRPGAATRS